jgi:hypothetical protein
MLREPRLWLLPDPFESLIFACEAKDAIQLAAAPHHANGMALADCVLADHELIFRLEVS